MREGAICEATETCGPTSMHASTSR